MWNDYIHFTCILIIAVNLLVAFNSIPITELYISNCLPTLVRLLVSQTYAIWTNLFQGIVFLTGFSVNDHWLMLCVFGSNAIEVIKLDIDTAIWIWFVLNLVNEKGIDKMTRIVYDSSFSWWTYCLLRNVLHMDRQWSVLLTCYVNHLQSFSHRNHQFVQQHYNIVTNCHHCQSVLFGVGNQGYQCQSKLLTSNFVFLLCVLHLVNVW